MVSDASDVVQCYNQDAVRSNVIYPEIVQSMMDESVMALTGIPQVGEAWKSLFPGIATDSVIGIKVNCINYRLSTHPEVTNAIVEGLARMQVGGSPFLRINVIIWDRGSSELTNAGYTIYTGSDPDTVRCYGVDGNWDVGNPLNVNGVTSNPAPQLSQSCDYLINAACLKDHSTARMTLTLKNHYGTVHNPGSLHGNHCNPYLPSLSAQIRDVLGDKQKLYIADGLFGIYTGGPGGSPQFVPELLLMSEDTVAIDYHGQSIINTERQAHGLNPKYAEHITTAAGPPYDLGTTEINLIELNNVGLAGSRAVPTPAGLQVTPDPFRSGTTVSFSLAGAGQVRLELVNGAGRTAATVFDGRLDSGRHELRFSPGRKLARGTYFLKLHDRSGLRVRKVTVLN
jgi:uncharacterized protein (DUF362 family)